MMKTRDKDEVWKQVHWVEYCPAKFMSFWEPQNVTLFGSGATAGVISSGEVRVDPGGPWVQRETWGEQRLVMEAKAGWCPTRQGFRDYWPHQSAEKGWEQLPPEPPDRAEHSPADNLDLHFQRPELGAPVVLSYGVGGIITAAAGNWTRGKENDPWSAGNPNVTHSWCFITNDGESSREKLQLRILQTPKVTFRDKKQREVRSERIHCYQTCHTRNTKFFRRKADDTGGWGKNKVIE